MQKMVDVKNHNQNVATNNLLFRISYRSTIKVMINNNIQLTGIPIPVF